MQSSEGRFVALAVVAVLLAVGAACSVSCVPTGHVGVVTTFGQVTGRQLPEGVNVVAPWQGVHDMSVRTQEIMESAQTPSSEGLIVGLEVSVIYRLNAPSASTVYQTIGREYQDVILTPTLRSAMRSATSAYRAEALYSTAREQVADQIRSELSGQIEPRGIVVESVLLRAVELPQTLRDAIETKQRVEQESLQMQFTLERERQEAERKRIEAEGVRDFQDIVTQGISDRLLAWKGIEATERLANSPNAKVVIIGSGENGLPIILGQ